MTPPGHQTPRILTAPEGDSPEAEAAAQVAAMGGIKLHPWQRLVLDTALREDSDARWAATEVAVVVPRQNGKGEILIARELAGLYVLGEHLILHSAHEFKTASDGYTRLLEAIESSPELDSKVAKKLGGHGNEMIKLKNGNRIQFIARTQGSGRGFTADLVILDEAYNLTEGQMSALLPTMAAVDNPQLWYTSSAVNAEEHPNGLVLTRTRNRGIRGTDGLAYMEWSPADDADPLDREVWAQANPALGRNVTLAGMVRDQGAMSQKTFAVERLGIGDWPAEMGSDRVISAAEWDAQLDADSIIDGRMVFAVDLSPDRTSAAISVAGKRAAGDLHVEVTEQGRGSSWIVPRLVELKRQWRPLAIVVDPGSPAGALLPELAQAGIEPMLTATRDVVQGCGAFYDGVMAHKVWHIGQGPLDQAVAGAKKRDLSGAWAWDRKNFMTDITPLVSVTLALWGYSVKSSEVKDVAASVW